MKVAYIGIDVLYPALVALAESGCDIVEIFSCDTDNITEFNWEVLDFAHCHNIPSQTDKMTVKDLRRLEEKGCDLILCGGYYHRIPVDTTIPMVNIHPSLLPEGRGAWPMPHVILNGEKKTGVSLHKMTEEFDGGDVLLQASCVVEERENLQTLTQKLQTLAAQLVTELMQKFSYLYENAAPQGVGSYLDYVQETDFVLGDTMTMAQADSILRGFYGYQCIYETDNHRYGVCCGEAVEEKPNQGVTLPLQDGYIKAEKIEVL